MAPKAKVRKSDTRACALWLPESKTIIGGEALGLPKLIPNVRFRIHAPYYGKPYVAMVMCFPLGENLNTTIFNDHAEVAKDLTVTLYFYKGKFEIKSADKLSDELYVRITGEQNTGKNKMFHIHLHSPSGPAVVGYPSPCPSTIAEVDSIINKGEKIGTTETTLMHIINAHEFHFVFKDGGLAKKAVNNFEGDLADNPNNISFPYGVIHTWDEEKWSRFQYQIPREIQYPPIYKFSNINDLLICLVQSTVQDSWPVIQLCKEIREKVEFECRVIKRKDDDFRVAIKFPFDFKSGHENLIPRITKPERNVNVFRGLPPKQGDDNKFWPTVILETTHEFSKHNVDLVLQMQPHSKDGGSFGKDPRFHIYDSYESAFAEGNEI
ncbi:uncharacterized protein B0J16DRAFT_408928 [Fusarium flagelliforme]|uniref:DNA helicase n=1 Tax=Fusarium flagelliforme TaxID=2675880 RepID=A0A395MX68_9HYPO|nr:uncharacterized protein B0J16DRAFT_408928 [Fusarium flagelliforme]KAH7197290.1 hypothetical protein B0J16DRAFT_408928 [Fusarium flagelliforme]RFN52265.1 DNA helicase [Fusarium flagelliforme]